MRHGHEHLARARFAHAVIGGEVDVVVAPVKKRVDGTLGFVLRRAIRDLAVTHAVRREGVLAMLEALPET